MLCNNDKAQWVRRRARVRCVRSSIPAPQNFLQRHRTDIRSCLLSSKRSVIFNHKHTQSVDTNRYISPDIFTADYFRWHFSANAQRPVFPRGTPSGARRAAHVDRDLLTKVQGMYLHVRFLTGKEEGEPVLQTCIPARHAERSEACRAIFSQA